jgi:hypothetical protein
VAYKRKVTRKQAAIIKARVLDPHATQKEIGDKLGIAQPHVARELAKPHVRAEIRSYMDERPKLRLGALMEKLEHGLDSTRIDSVKLEGSIIKVATEVDDQPTRHRFLETAFKLRGALGPDASDGTPSGPVNIAIIMAGGGSDVERKAMAEVLEAAAITRGLK